MDALALVSASSPSAPPMTKAASAFRSCANCTVVKSSPRSSSAIILIFLGIEPTRATWYPFGMRLAYSAQAASAHAGSLASSATTCRRATFRGLLLRRRLLRHGFRGLVGFQLDRLAAPDFFQVVEAAHRRMHDVHHDVAEIDEDPFAARLAFDAVDAPARLLDLLPDTIGERAYLRARSPGGDHHALEHGGHARGVEDDDVVAFHILEGVDYGALLGSGVHQR